MRAFLMSIAAIMVIVLVSVFVLDFVQETSAAAYSTIGVRV